MTRLRMRLLIEVVAAAFLILPLLARGGPAGLAHDGVVRLHVFHTDEYAEIRYLDAKGAWIAEAEERLVKLLRSRGDGRSFPIDRRLIALADHLQDHFLADTVEVISAYRSPEFNRSLKETGHHVAKESLHMKGLAMDIHLDEVREDTLRDYLLTLKLGGVGYYGDKLMVHMDLGPVRAWRDGGFTENTGIGVFNGAGSLRLRTDRLNYAPGDLLRLAAQPPQKHLTGRMALEKYFRGGWIEVRSWKNDGTAERDGLRLEERLLTGGGKTLSSYGKFRLRLETGHSWQNSNEFYVKRM